MEKILVKLSRRRSVMVPAVTLLAIGIGISGYYIQNRQIVAREQEQQTQRDKGATVNNTVDPAELSEKDTIDVTTKVTEDGTAAKVVATELEIENRPENSEVILTAKIDSKKAGDCVFYLKQGNYGPEETVPVKDGVCEARLQNPGIGTWEGKVLFTSSDGETRGDAKQNIEL